MESKIEELEGHNKACKYCWEFFTSVRSDAKYCCAKCRSKYYQRKLRRKARLQAFLKVFGLGVKKKTIVQPEELSGQNDSSKIEYVRLTFILSLLGFIGSIGFYLGVLRELHSPALDKHKIELLEEQNEDLQKAVTFLVEELEESE